jgi:hypothetical protein
MLGGSHALHGTGARTPDNVGTVVISYNMVK